MHPVERGRVFKINPITPVTQNLSAWWTRERPEAVEANLRELVLSYGLVGCQEAGHANAWAILRRLRRERVLDFYPSGGLARGGRQSTPVVWDPKKCAFVSGRSIPLTPELKIAIGAGPTVIKPKFANHVKFKKFGRTVHVINIHGLASVWARPRWYWVNKFFKNLAKYASTLEGVVLIIGDFNTHFESRWMQPLREAGFRSLQHELGPVKTHKVGIPDDILFKDTPFRLAPVDLRAEKRASDHKALIGTFDLRSTHEWALNYNKTKIVGS
jgi:hypothetical protein